MKITELQGKTIQSVEVIPSELGRTYGFYACIVCTNGEKCLVAKITGNDLPYKPMPRIDDMRKAPLFFTPEDIAQRVLEEETERRRATASEVHRAKERIEQLQNYVTAQGGKS